MTHKKYSDFEILRQLILMARAYWGHILLISILGLVAIPFTLMTPVPLKVAVDSVLSSAPLPGFLDGILPDNIKSSKMGLLWLVIWMQLGIVLLTHLQSLGTYLFQTYTGHKLNLIFRSRLFRHVQRLSFAFHDSRGTAHSIYRIQYDASAIEYILIYGIIPFLNSIITLIAMFFVIMRINSQMALIAMIISPVFFFLSQYFVRTMRPKYKDVKVMENVVLNIIQEVMNAYRVVKAFGREESEEQRFVQQSNKVLRQKVRLSFFEGVYGLGINLASAIGTAAVLYFGVTNVLSGQITLGELLMVITYLAQLYGPLRSISQQVAALQSYFVSAQRAFELMDEIPDVIDLPHAKHIIRSKGEIEFEDVSFSYDGGKTFVLQDINFQVPVGKRVGIAGRTGVGKTTLVSLLPRFYDCTKGKILLDGIDIHDYKIADLRNQFAIVLQDPLLFSTTIEENIRYAKPNASQYEIHEAAKAANAHEFIMRLPDQYDTLVGERGMRLSGGERQRISLARAFLKDAPVLILDEPTASVDTKTETLIMEAMEKLMKDRTTFMIAHRLSTLAKCDIQLEIKLGRVQDSREVIHY